MDVEEIREDTRGRRVGMTPLKVFNKVSVCTKRMNRNKLVEEKIEGQLDNAGSC